MKSMGSWFTHGGIAEIVPDGKLPRMADGEGAVTFGVACPCPGRPMFESPCMGIQAAFRGDPSERGIA